MEKHEFQELLNSQVLRVLFDAIQKDDEVENLSDEVEKLLADNISEKIEWCWKCGCLAITKERNSSPTYHPVGFPLHNRKSGITEIPKCIRTVIVSIEEIRQGFVDAIEIIDKKQSETETIKELKVKELL